MSAGDKPLAALLPCPHCGGAMQTYSYEVGDSTAETWDVRHVAPNDCRGGMDCLDSEAAAIAAWNRRAASAGKGWTEVTDEPATWPLDSDGGERVLVEYKCGLREYAVTDAVRDVIEERKCPTPERYRVLRWMPWPSAAPAAPPSAEACYYCGTPCEPHAGDPGRWPVHLPHADAPGVARAHHAACVMQRLEPAPDGAADRVREAAEALTNACFLTGKATRITLTAKHVEIMLRPYFGART